MGMKLGIDVLDCYKGLQPGTITYIDNCASNLGDEVYAYIRDVLEYSKMKYCYSDDLSHLGLYNKLHEMCADCVLCILNMRKVDASLTTTIVEAISNIVATSNVIFILVGGSDAVSDELFYISDNVISCGCDYNLFDASIVVWNNVEL